MEILKKIPDNFAVGVGIGLICPLFIYGAIVLPIKLEGSLLLAKTFYENLQLFLIGANAVIFRYFMINIDRFKTGRGIFLVTLLFALAWVVIYKTDTL